MGRARAPLWVTAGLVANQVAAASGAAACPSSTTVAAEDWQQAEEALAYLAGPGAAAGEPPGKPPMPWTNWAEFWLPLGRQVSADLVENLKACPEAAVTAAIHSLGVIDEREGAFASMHVVKMLHHLLPNLAPQEDAVVADVESVSSWRRHWLLTVTSLLRFVYLKWIQVPQISDLRESSKSDESGAVDVPMPSLTPHHRFLFRHTIDEFRRSGALDVEFTEKGIIFSEAFAFVSFCRLHQIERVVETGVYKGWSTEVWSLFVDDVVGNDIFIRQEAEERLAKRPNVQLVTGDGFSMIPQLLAEEPNRRTAVFIDGPKGELAIRLALSLKGIPQIAFIAIHDMPPYKQELKGYGAFFFSDEPWFVEEYGFLDKVHPGWPDVERNTMAFLPPPQ